MDRAQQHVPVKGKARKNQAGQVGTYNPTTKEWAMAILPPAILMEALCFCIFAGWL